MTDGTPTTSDPTRSTGERILTTTPTTEVSVSTPAWTPRDRRGVIWVTADRDPDSVLDHLRSPANGTLPPRVDVIAIDDCLRSSVAEGGVVSTTVPIEPTALTVHTIAADSDIDTIGQALIETVTGLDHSGLVPHLVIDNLGDILSPDDEEQIFQFLHLITGTARAHGWPVNVTLDPDRVPPEIIELVTPLFDDVR